MTTDADQVRIVNDAQLVKSIRDTGYKTPDYAISELIDNSIQAGAANIWVVVVQERVQGKKRATTRAVEIWVIDDGEGMDERRAHEALSFGRTTRYNDRRGMGRFGVGLPQSSVSQCKRTDLWTWQRSGPRDSWHTYLDLDLIEQEEQGLNVPPPTKRDMLHHIELPSWVAEVADTGQTAVTYGYETRSGTAIRWSNLDKCRWARASTIKSNTEYLLGRIYRKFLVGDAVASHGARSDVGLRFAILDRQDADHGKTPQFDDVLPNDPLYLMTPAGTNLEHWQKLNAEWDGQSGSTEYIEIDDLSLFLPFPPQLPEAVRVDVNDQDGVPHEVRVRYSAVRPEGRPPHRRNVGTVTHQGKHTRDNRGISIVRAGREIVMDTTAVYEATDRWWSVEIDFPPTLDDMFGITNNKQDVPYFTSALKYALNSDGQPDPVGDGQLAEGDPLVGVWRLATQVAERISQMRQEVKNERSRSRTNYQNAKKPSDAKPLPGKSVDVKRRLAVDEPTPGERDHLQRANEDGEIAARENNARRIEAGLERDGGLTHEEISAITSQYMQGLDFQVVEKDNPQTDAFFWTEEYGDFQVVYINQTHVFVREMLDLLRLSNESIAAMEPEKLRMLLGGASDVLGWMLIGWSRMESAYGQDVNSSDAIKRWRVEWGRNMKRIVQTGDADPIDPEMLEDLIEALGDESDG